MPHVMDMIYMQRPNVKGKNRDVFTISSFILSELADSFLFILQIEVTVTNK